PGTVVESKLHFDLIPSPKGRTILDRRINSDRDYAKASYIPVDGDDDLKNLLWRNILKDTGINRISIGCQSAIDSELKELGRIHRFEDFLRTYELFRNEGIQNINVDLMSNIPNQTLESLAESLDKIVALSPEHVSAYSLIVEPGTPFYELWQNGKLNIADEDMDRKMYDYTGKYLKEKGYSRYEISNYAKSGYECKHNMVYWSGGEYIGVGLGSSSYFKGVRYKNPSDFEEYFKYIDDIEGADPDELFSKHYQEVSYISAKEEMEEFFFLGLRKIAGVNAFDFKMRFNRDVTEVYAESLKHLTENGLMVFDRESGQIYLTDKGLDISNYCMEQFLLE
ncbi:MAG: hypothetical protein K6G11_00085, partial [Lachnospiraceae bacterium]|nr:hypothetical protein [Lachnospiraceae bacterium]